MIYLKGYHQNGQADLGMNKVSLNDFAQIVGISS